MNNSRAISLLVSKIKHFVHTKFHICHRNRTSEEENGSDERPEEENGSDECLEEVVTDIVYVCNHLKYMTQQRDAAKNRYKKWRNPEDLIESNILKEAVAIETRMMARRNLPSRGDPFESFIFFVIRSVYKNRFLYAATHEKSYLQKSQAIQAASMKLLMALKFKRAINAYLERVNNGEQ